MSSAGHVMDMIRRMKANRELLKAKRGRHSKLKAMYQKAAYGKKSINPLDHLSEAELAIIRTEIVTKLAADRKRSSTKLVLIGVILLALAVWLMVWVFRG